MPFTKPTTVTSKANDGYLAQFYIGDSSSPPTYTAVAELREFDAAGFTMPQVENTTLLSPNNMKEFVPGMKEPGKVSFGGNFTGDASQLNLNTLATNQTVFPFKVVAAVNRKTQTYTLLGEGFIASYSVGPFKVNEAIQFKGEIQLTGGYTETVV